MKNNMKNASTDKYSTVSPQRGVVLFLPGGRGAPIPAEVI